MDLPLPGGYLDVEYFAGSGANTAYFAVDFAGNGGDTFAFGYQWDGAATAADALLAISASPGGLVMGTTDFGGSLGLGLDRFAYLLNDHEQFWSVDDQRYWKQFVGTYALGDVTWAVSDFGISGQPLTDGGFNGYLVDLWDSSLVPRLPVAVPEPSALVLLLIGAGFCLWRVRRRGKNVAL
jgi:hypothetical protein